MIGEIPFSHEYGAVRGLTGNSPEPRNASEVVAALQSQYLDGYGLGFLANTFAFLMPAIAFGSAGAILGGKLAAPLVSRLAGSLLGKSLQKSFMTLGDEAGSALFTGGWRTFNNKTESFLESGGKDFSTGMITRVVMLGAMMLVPGGALLSTVGVPLLMAAGSFFAESVVEKGRKVSDLFAKGAGYEWGQRIISSFTTVHLQSNLLLRKAAPAILRKISPRLAHVQSLHANDWEITQKHLANLGAIEPPVPLIERATMQIEGFQILAGESLKFPSNVSFALFRALKIMRKQTTHLSDLTEIGRLLRKQKGSKEEKRLTRLLDQELYPYLSRLIETAHAMLPQEKFHLSQILLRWADGKTPPHQESRQSHRDSGYLILSVTPIGPSTIIDFRGKHLHFPTRTPLLLSCMDRTRRTSTPATQHLIPQLKRGGRRCVLLLIFGADDGWKGDKFTHSLYKQLDPLGYPD